MTGAELATWTGVCLAGLALVVAWATYRSQSEQRGIEYLVLSNQRLVSPRVAGDLEVSFRGQVVEAPALTVLRMVSTGDRAIAAAAFEGPLVVTLAGARRVVSASVSAMRPRDLPVVLSSEGDAVHVDPLLLNPGDFLEIQALTEGQPEHVRVSGRIADVKPRRRTQLPYPPGSGLEGEMTGFDKFMWIVPEVLVAACLLAVIVVADLSATARVAWVVVVAVVFGIIYPVQVRRLVRRRRNWRP